MAVRGDNNLLFRVAAEFRHVGIGDEIDIGMWKVIEAVIHEVYSESGECSCERCDTPTPPTGDDTGKGEG